MSKSITVIVEEKHIRDGIAKDNNSCPIALAIKEQQKVSYVHVDDTGYCEVGDLFKGYIISLEAQKFIEDFDSGKKVEPATFVFQRDPEEDLQEAGEEEVRRQSRPDDVT